MNARMVIAALAALAAIPTAHADLYLGISYGKGYSWNAKQYAPTEEVAQREYPVNDVDEHNYTAGLFAGARAQYVGAEIGYIRLPDYYAFAVGLNPYRITTQDISANAAYVRSLLWSPSYRGVSVYGFYGVARVTGRNYERANNSELGIVEHRNKTEADRPYKGGGVEFRLSHTLSGRIEYGVIRDAVVSWWTGERHYRMVSASVVATF